MVLWNRGLVVARGERTAWHRGTVEEWRHGFVGELKSDLFLFFSNLKTQLSNTGIINWNVWRNGSVIENRRIKKKFIHLGHTVKSTILHH